MQCIYENKTEKTFSIRISFCKLITWYTHIFMIPGITGVRTDERAPRSSGSSCSHRSDSRRVFQRSGRTGCATLHWQHFPFHTGRIRGKWGWPDFHFRLRGILQCKWCTVNQSAQCWISSESCRMICDCCLRCNVLKMMNVAVYWWLVCLIEGVCLAGSYPLSCRLPANPGHRHGYHAGKNYYNQERIHHISTGKVLCFWYTGQIKVLWFWCTVQVMWCVFGVLSLHDREYLLCSHL